MAVTNFALNETILAIIQKGDTVNLFFGKR